MGFLPRGLWKFVEPHRCLCRSIGKRLRGGQPKRAHPAIQLYGHVHRHMGLPGNRQRTVQHALGALCGLQRLSLCGRYEQSQDSKVHGIESLRHPVGLPGIAERAIRKPAGHRPRLEQQRLRGGHGKQPDSEIRLDGRFSPQVGIRRYRQRPVQFAVSRGGEQHRGCLCGGHGQSPHPEVHLYGCLCRHHRFAGYGRRAV